MLASQYAIAQHDLGKIKFKVFCIIQVKGSYYSSLFALGPRTTSLLMTGQ